MKHAVRVLLVLCLFASATRAQLVTDIQFYRPNTQHGLNIFEPSKRDTVVYRGPAVRIGGQFTQDFQALDHERSTSQTIDTAKALQLVDLIPGFNLAMANMTLDAQLADGIRSNVTLYLSSRHHQEAWVKGGYIQFDKLPFAGTDDLMRDLRIIVGMYDVNFGDAHYRRTDAGNAMFNPFVENYLIDDFSTEIGGEIQYLPESGIIAVLGVTDGMLNPTVVETKTRDTVDRDLNSFNPAIYLKLGYDKQLSDDLRFRLTGSLYNVSSSNRNTLFAGDRAGSHYFLVTETSTDTKAAFTSGRFSPNLTDDLMAIMINPFVKFGGLELFGTFLTANGRTPGELEKRSASQIAADLLFRFGADEDFYIGGRFNTVTAEIMDKGKQIEVGIDRITAGGGWYVLPSVLMKLEYVSQNYKDFPVGNLFNEMKFSGAVLEAVLGF